jgi:hypothetical protein
MEIKGADIKQRLREGRWRWWAPAAFFVGICFLPSGWIEASPGQVFRPPVLFAPMAWPLFAMGLVFGAAAFSLRLRRHAWHVLFFGTGAAILFTLLLLASSGAVALYSWELGADLQNRIFLDFELNILAFLVQPIVIILFAVSGLVLWARGGKPGPEAPGLYFPIAAPEPTPPAAPVLPEVPVTATEPASGTTTPEAPAADAGRGTPSPPPPSEPASPLDAITGTTPEAKPAEGAPAPAEDAEPAVRETETGPAPPETVPDPPEQDLPQPAPQGLPASGQPPAGQK